MAWAERPGEKGMRRDRCEPERGEGRNKARRQARQSQREGMGAEQPGKEGAEL